MSTIKIICDSTCDLSKEIINERNIVTFPLKVCFGEDMFLDQIDITTAEMYKKVEETGTLPKTAAATIDEFVELFKKYIENAERGRSNADYKRHQIRWSQRS